VAAKHDETTVPEVEARDTSSSEARMAAAPSEEAALVLAAMRALRRAHDPVKAGVLLEQYLSRFPGGVLVEEALALGMEAALDRADAATARRLAERYTQRYPAGRFGALARRATASKGP
jgi:outer membrane protein assembly factor BamD (BamD/ComL family)